MAPGMEDETDGLLQLISDIRGVSLQADPVALNEVRAFLLRHEAESAKSASHTVLENYPDWWVRRRRAPPGLSIEGAEALEELNRHVGFMHSLGVPMTLAERRTTPCFRFFQDLEAWGSREAAPLAASLFSPDSALTRLIGAVVGEVFPSHGGFLDVAVYNATGLSQTKGVRKTSLRLVWPGILIDADRAVRVRDLVVSRLVAATSAEGGALADMEAELKKANGSNTWHSLVSDAAYSSRSVVRMPLCDRVAPLPLRGPEKRPLNPVGVMRYSYGDKMKVEWLCKEADLDPAEWMKIGCLRQEGEVQLTDWSMPAYRSHELIPLSAARGYRVKVRTVAGSDGPTVGGGLRMARKQVAERAGQLQALERSFSCTPQEFAEKMEPQLGKAGIEPDGSHVWKQPSSDARIVMYGDDKLIKVIGRPNQVRSLVMIVAPHTEASKRIGLANGDEPDANGFANGTNGYHKEEATKPSEASGPDTPETEKERRLALQNFDSLGQSELGLKEGDVVWVLLDPQAGNVQDVDRWVYGKKECGQHGWFPLSHTKPADEIEGDAVETAERTPKIETAERTPKIALESKSQSQD